MIIYYKKINVPRGTFKIYRPKYTNKTEISAGETPLTLDACDMVTG